MRFFTTVLALLLPSLAFAGSPVIFSAGCTSGIYSIPGHSCLVTGGGAVSPNTCGSGQFAIGIAGDGTLTCSNPPSGPANTDALSEGTTNLYFSNARARAAVSSTAPISYSSTTGVISCVVATGSVAGCLGPTDFAAFTAKQAALTFGSLTDAGTDGISVTGGTNAVVGAGVALSQHVADATHNGYLGTTDFGVFTGKQDSLITSACSAHQFGTGFTSPNTFPCAQPASSDLSDSANIDLLNGAQTYTAAKINSTSGAASTPAMKLSGAPFAGTATTSKPQLSLEWGAPTSTAWSTGGTAIGVNAAFAFVGKLLDLQANGKSAFSVDYGNSSSANAPGTFVRNMQDNSNGGLNICGQTGAVGASPNCSSLYAGNGGTFGWYSLAASGGSFQIWSAQMNWATMVIGDASMLQAFSSSTQPALLVTNQNWANASTQPTLGLVPKTSQTAPLIQSYQPHSTSPGAFQVDINYNLTAANVKSAGGHYQSTGTAPTATVSANAGVGASCSVSHATDAAGVVTLVTTAVSGSAGAECDVNFNAAYGVAPVCTFTAANAAAASVGPTVDIYATSTTAKVTINFAAADLTGGTYAYNFHCVETQ